MAHLAAGTLKRCNIFDENILLILLGLMGVGRMWSPKTGWGNAKDVLEQNGLDLIEYKPKEVKTD